MWLSAWLGHCQNMLFPVRNSKKPIPFLQQAPGWKNEVKKIFILILFFCFIAVPRVHAAQINKVAAVVNGQVITMFDLQKEALQEFARARINPNDPARKKEVDKILGDVLDMMILDILVSQEAKRLKASVSQAEVREEINRIMKERNMTKKQFQEQLARQKMTEETLRKDLEKGILRQKVMSMEVGRKVIVTPEEIASYYNQHKDSMVDRSGLHMGLLVYPPNVNAAAIAAQIKSGKISFQDACAKYSIAPNKDKSGDTGPLDWDRLNPEWGPRLRGMKPGDVTDLFTLQGKFKAQVRLFRPNGDHSEKKLTLEEARPQIDAILRQPKARARFDDYKQQLRKKAVLDIRLEGYKQKNDQAPAQPDSRRQTR